MRKILILFSLALCTSCTSTKFNLKPDLQIETLSICVSYSDVVPDSVRSRFDKAISGLIVKFNSSPHKFKLSTCNDSTKSAFKVYVKKTSLISTPEQIGATLANLVGITLPIVLIATYSSFYVAFCYFPNDVSRLNYGLTNDLTLRDTTINKTISSTGYLQSKKRQIINHSITFREFLKKELIKLEKQYIKESRLKK